MSVARPLLATVLVVALALPAGAADEDTIRCTDPSDDVDRLEIVVEGEVATGRFALPAHEPTGLVVIGHGYGHTSRSWKHHMQTMAKHGLVAVTMDYRGTRIGRKPEVGGSPTVRGWPAMDGAEDLIAAARLFDEWCAPPVVTLLGVSMGGNITGVALAKAGERGIRGHDGSPLFDYWIDVEGVVNLVETYLEGRTACAALGVGCREVEDMHREAGGPIEQRPEAYVERSVVARIGDVRASGVRGVIVSHGVDDGLVPYNQSREISTELRLVGVPTEMRTVGLEDEDTERETTLTGHLVGQIEPGYDSPLAGHASERSTTHIVMEDALDRLWTLMGGSQPANRECAVNGQVPARVLCTP
ncbi:MAG TPA: alpha/beta fold hydrolase [Actinomycetota bacterium]|nr:alpha/beta fold hydrolase [Actinomycetota bacterium]